MDWVGAIELLRFLLPGFIMAWVYYGLTAHVRPSQFERLIQALIFTLLVKAGLVLVHSLVSWIGRWLLLGSWSDNAELLWSIGLALLFGTLLSWAINADALHRLLRRFGITNQTSHPSVWHSTLASGPWYLVLHLKDGRRIYGWANRWSDDPKSGHFSIEEAEWLGDENDRIPMEGVLRILVPVEDVTLVEIMDL